jgi:hypothetical protein
VGQSLLPAAKDVLRHALRGPGLSVETLGRAAAVLGPALARAFVRKRKAAGDLAAGLVGTAPVDMTVDVQLGVGGGSGDDSPRAISHVVAAPVSAPVPLEQARRGAGGRAVQSAISLAPPSSATPAADGDSYAPGARVPARFQSVRVRLDRPARGGILGALGQGSTGGPAATADGNSAGAVPGAAATATTTTTPAGARAAAATGAAAASDGAPQPFALLLMQYMGDLLKVRPLSQVAPSLTLTSAYQVRARITCMRATSGASPSMTTC